MIKEWTSRSVSEFHKALHWKVEDLAIRLADIICGREVSRFCLPYLKSNGGWQLDMSNNWWLHPEPSKGQDVYRLIYRYTLTDEQSKAFQVLFTWAFDKYHDGWLGSENKS